MTCTDYIKLLSKASNKWGDKLVEVMDMHGAISLQQLTEEQLRYFCIANNLIKE